MFADSSLIDSFRFSEFLTLKWPIAFLSMYFRFHNSVKSARTIHVEIGKGQLILEWNFVVFNSPKKPTKF